jgi:hypothetical protein
LFKKYSKLVDDPLEKALFFSSTVHGRVKLAMRNLITLSVAFGLFIGVPVISLVPAFAADKSAAKQDTKVEKKETKPEEKKAEEKKSEPKKADSKASSKDAKAK